MADRPRGRGRARGRARGHRPAPAGDEPAHAVVAAQPAPPREIVDRDLQFRARTFSPRVQELDTRTREFAKTLGFDPLLDQAPGMINPHGPAAYLRQLFTAKALAIAHDFCEGEPTIVDAYGSDRTTTIAHHLNGRLEGKGHMAPEIRPIHVHIRGVQMVGADLRRRLDDNATGLFSGLARVDCLLFVNVYSLGEDALAPVNISIMLNDMRTRGSTKPCVLLIHRDFCDSIGTDACGTYRLFRDRGALRVIDHPYEVPRTSAPYGPHPVLEWALTEGAEAGVSWATMHASHGLRLTMCALSRLPAHRALGRPNALVGMRVMPDYHLFSSGWWTQYLLSFLPGRWRRWACDYLMEKRWLAGVVVEVDSNMLASLVQRFRTRQISAYMHGQLQQIAEQTISERLDRARFDAAFPGLLSQMAGDLARSALVRLSDETSTLEAQNEYIGADSAARNVALGNVGRDTSVKTWVPMAMAAGVVVLAFVAGRYLNWEAASKTVLSATREVAVSVLVEEAVRFALRKVAPNYSLAMNTFAFPFADALADWSSGRVGEVSYPLMTHMWLFRTIAHNVFYGMQSLLPGGPLVAAAAHYAWNCMAMQRMGSPIWPLASSRPRFLGVGLGVCVAAVCLSEMYDRYNRPPTPPDRWEEFKTEYLTPAPELKRYVPPADTCLVTPLILDGRHNVTHRVHALSEIPGDTNPEYDVKWLIPHDLELEHRPSPCIHHALANNVPHTVPARSLHNLIGIVEQRLIAAVPYNTLPIPPAFDIEEGGFVPGSLIQYYHWIGQTDLYRVEDIPDWVMRRLDPIDFRPEADVVTREFHHSILMVLRMFKRAAIVNHWTEIERDAQAFCHTDTVLQVFINHLPPHARPRMLRALQDTQEQPHPLAEDLGSTEVMTKTDEQLFKLDYDGLGFARVSKPRPIANVRPVHHALTGPEIYESTNRLKLAFGPGTVASRNHLFFEQIAPTAVAMNPPVEGIHTRVADLHLPWNLPIQGKVPTWIVYAPGAELADLVALYTKFMTAPTTSDWCLILVAGDDAAIHGCIDTLVFSEEHDGSVFDQCQAIGPRTFEFCVQRMLGVPQHTLNNLASISRRPYRAQLRTKTGAIQVAKVTPIYPSTVHRDTGGPNTSQGNSIVGIPLAVRVASSLLTSLSNFARWYKKNRTVMESEVQEQLAEMRERAVASVTDLGFKLKLKFFIGPTSFHRTTFLKSVVLPIVDDTIGYRGGPLEPIFGPVCLSGRLLKAFKTLRDPRELVVDKATGRALTDYAAALKIVIGNIMVSAATSFQGPLFESAIQGWAPYARQSQYTLKVSLEKATGYRPNMEGDTGGGVTTPRAWRWIQRGCPADVRIDECGGFYPEFDAWFEHSRDRYGPAFDGWADLADLLETGSPMFVEHPLWLIMASVDYN